MRENEYDWSGSGIKKVAKSPKGMRRWQQLLKAGAVFFAKKGYYNTSIEDLAEEAGISKATVYHYCKSKDEFFFAILEQGLEDFTKLLDRAMENTGTSLEKLSALVRTYIQFYLDKPEVFHILTREVRVMEQKLDLVPPNLFQLLEERIEQIIAYGIKQGEFRDLPPLVSAHAFLGMIDFMVTGNQFKDQLRDEQFMETIISIIGNGLLRS